MVVQQMLLLGRFIIRKVTLITLQELNKRLPTITYENHINKDKYR